MEFLLDGDVPDDIAYSIEALGHVAIRLRTVYSRDPGDSQVLEHAITHGQVLVTCNRDDFLLEAAKGPHAGIVILVRRRSRALERAAFVRLLDSAGESVLRGNVNFA